MKFAELIRQLHGKQALLAILIDPDKFNAELVKEANRSNTACFLLGGSKLERGSLQKTARQIKTLSSKPLVLFPGDEKQLSPRADGLLLLSLLSGRNADYLIGKHILAAPIIRKMQLPYLSTAYLLIGTGSSSSTEKVTRTRPLDQNDRKRIVHTAMAAEQLGFKAIYLEAGSGSKESLPASLIRTIKKEVNLPLIVGGGIDSGKRVRAAIKAGANMVVVGNALEKNVHLLKELSACFG
ncbi:MAG TPA: geranylgeranylglyceryl/heptaprenylglyceryl phosphate synthase [Bacteroidia bacterium]|nr:geranylgeranylglyceryl/heptaprenylglyceryl phosphate synthase [Bacteroidia bacterium]